MVALALRDVFTVVVPGESRGSFRVARRLLSAMLPIWKIARREKTGHIHELRAFGADGVLHRMDVSVASGLRTRTHARKWLLPPAVVRHSPDRDRLRTLHDDWVGLNATQQVARPSPNAAQSASIVLSMSPQTPADQVEQAARVWARETLGGQYDYVMVRHDPEVDKDKLLGRICM